MTETPRSAARKILLDLYDRASKNLGRRPSETEFFPVDVEEIVSMIGWQIRQISNLTERGEPLAGRVNFEQKTLYVESEDAGPRRSFTVAHEIGHIVLRHTCTVAFRPSNPHSVLRPHTIGTPSRSTKLQERQANAFAAELLMPERAVRREFQKRFGCDELGIGSLRAQTIISNLQTRGEDLAADLAVIKYPSPTVTSLVEFFRVSQIAMGRRLIELSLIY